MLELSTEIDGIREPFCVERREEDGEYIFKDSYFGYVVRDEFESKVSEYAKKYFLNCKVFAAMDSIWYPNSLTGEANLDDMMELKDEIKGIVVFVVVNESFNSVEEFRKVAETFVNEWAEVEMDSMVRVLYVKDSVYETIERDNYLNALGDGNITEYLRMVE